MRECPSGMLEEPGIVRRFTDDTRHALERENR
jgi:hypothetical protein